MILNTTQCFFDSLTKYFRVGDDAQTFHKSKPATLCSAHLAWVSQCQGVVHYHLLQRRETSIPLCYLLFSIRNFGCICIKGGEI